VHGFIVAHTRNRKRTGSMIIFIGNLPAGMTARAINELAGRDTAMPVRICKKDDGAGGLHRYALLHVKSVREGLRLIRRLDGVDCLGNRLVAREYAHRKAANERRRLDWRSVPWDGPERRRGERRATRSRSAYAGRALVRGS
jgi:hypothetical protein